LVDTGQGFSILYYNKYLYDNTTPISSAENRLNTINITSDTLYIIASPLLYYGFNIIQAKIPESSLIYSIECDEKLFKISANINNNYLYLIDKNSNSQQLHLLAEKIIYEVNQKQLKTIRRITFLSCNGGRLLNQNYYKQFEIILNEQLRQYWRNKATSIFLGRRWIRNIFQNIKNMPFKSVVTPSINPAPILLCGAGPSIETMLPYLSFAKKTHTIMAVDTALPILKTCGIDPDYVIVLEGQWHNIEDFFVAMPNSTCTILADLSVHAPTLSMLSKFSTVKVFSSQIIPLNFWQLLQTSLPNWALIPPLGSVGVCALYLALQYFSGQVVLSGLDFQEQIGKSHGRHSMSHLSGLFRSSRLRPHSWLQRAFGNTSNPVLEAYGLQAKHLIENFPNRVIDIRDHGMELGIARTAVADYFDSIKKNWQHSAKVFTPKDNSIDQTKLRSGFSKVILTIQGNLLSAENMINEYFSKPPIDSPITDDLTKVLQSLDILWIDFPEHVKTPYTKELLWRILIRIQEVRSILFTGL